MLACTLEIEEATIGGLACAVGMTTASHKYGLLQETVEEFEIVVGDGELVKARRTGKHADLFHAFPWSHGSLGLLVGLTLKVRNPHPIFVCTLLLLGRSLFQVLKKHMRCVR
jgi:delta24-sterol reductase